MTAALLPNRPALLQRSRRLNYATLAYNSLEGALSISAGLMAGSIALVGFGTDSLIELTAGAAALWRLSADLNPARRERVEQQTLRLIGLCFLALAAYVRHRSDSCRRRPNCAGGKAPARALVSRSPRCS